MTRADWDRLQYYCRRVNFICSGTYGPPVHPSTYVRIGQIQSRSSSPLFPSLYQLKYELFFNCIFENFNVFLFLSPLLESLELTRIRGFENTTKTPFWLPFQVPLRRRGGSSLILVEDTSLEWLEGGKCEQ